MEHRYLYRALREVEIQNNLTLIPKSQEPFLADPRLDIDTRLPFILGPTVEYAIRQHNYNQKGYPTRGISTTPFYERALFYSQRHRVIVKIDTGNFNNLGLKVHKVSNLPYGIAVPEDDEHIIVYEKVGDFPSEIIAEVIDLRQETT